MKIITWTEAKRLWLRRYFTGKPCRRGHVGERYIHGDCILCTRSRYDPDELAARAGLAGARKRAPGCVPDDFDLYETIPFYEEARRLTQRTRIRHEVDHIIALNLGGKHVASNLQVITRRENRAKGRIEQEEVNRRRRK